MIYIKTRTFKKSITGPQGYTREVLKILNKENSFKIIQPKSLKKVFIEYFWEQLILPIKTFDKYLWSPSNTAQILKKKTIFIIRDLISFNNPEWFTKKYVSFYRFVHIRAIKNVKKILTISMYLKSRIDYYFPNSASIVKEIYLEASEQLKPFPKINYLTTHNKHNLFILSILMFLKNISLEKKFATYF